MSKDLTPFSLENFSGCQENGPVIALLEGMKRISTYIFCLLLLAFQAESVPQKYKHPKITTTKGGSVTGGDEKGNASPLNRERPRQEKLKETQGKRLFEDVTLLKEAAKEAQGKVSFLKNQYPKIGEYIHRQLNAIIEGTKKLYLADEVILLDKGGSAPVVVGAYNHTTGLVRENGNLYVSPSNLRVNLKGESEARIRFFQKEKLTQVLVHELLHEAIPGKMGQDENLVAAATETLITGQLFSEWVSGQLKVAEESLERLSNYRDYESRLKGFLATLVMSQSVYMDLEEKDRFTAPLQCSLKENLSIDIFNFEKASGEVIFTPESIKGLLRTAEEQPLSENLGYCLIVLSVVKSIYQDTQDSSKNNTFNMYQPEEEVLAKTYPDYIERVFEYLKKASQFKKVFENRKERVDSHRKESEQVRKLTQFSYFKNLILSLKNTSFEDDNFISKMIEKTEAEILKLEAELANQGFFLPQTESKKSRKV